MKQRVLVRVRCTSPPLDLSTCEAWMILVKKKQQQSAVTKKLWSEFLFLCTALLHYWSFKSVAWIVLGLCPGRTAKAATICPPFGEHKNVQIGFRSLYHSVRLSKKGLNMILEFSLTLVFSRRRNRHLGSCLAWSWNTF